jgi:hypothetical protein
MPLPLEDCCGAFSPIFKEQWSALPMPGSHLIFAPKVKDGRVWKHLDEAIEDGRLYDELFNQDPFKIRFPTDTRHSKDFTGPQIFISFAWEDIKIVKKIILYLLEKKRRYFLFYAPFQGLGKDTKQNSITAVQDITAVQEADSILIIISERYVLRHKDAPNGNIANEIFEIGKRFSIDGLKPAFLSIDDSKYIKDKLPFTGLGIEGAPFIGKPLKDASGKLIQEAVDEALKMMDENWQKRQEDEK